MHVNKATERFYAQLPKEPLVGISNVADNMNTLNTHFKPAGYEHFEPFGISYLAVTNTIHEQVETQKATGIQYFRHPEVLDVAIGKFHHKYTEPFRQHIDGVDVKPHWDVLHRHELAREADMGVKAVVGYMAHIIGGDLAATVYETEQSGLFSPEVMREYIKYDYNKIDDSLAIAAKKLAPQLIETQNPKTRDLMVKLAMSGIVVGRKWARHDFHKLTRAKSDDHRESIIHSAERRTARLAAFVLETSYTLQGLKGSSKEPPQEGLTSPKRAA